MKTFNYDFGMEILRELEELQNPEFKGDSRWIYIGEAKQGETRYALGEIGERPLICFGLNPSTAVPNHLDPTLTTVRNVAKLHGYDGWIMLNIFPIRRTLPRDMLLDIRSGKTTNEIAEAIEMNRRVAKLILQRFPEAPLWAAWGNNIEKNPAIGAIFNVDRRMWLDRKWLSRGPISKNGHPHHPLYVKMSEPLIPFNFWHYLYQLQG